MLSQRVTKQILVVLIVLLTVAIGWKSCTLSDQEIRACGWKYNDVLPPCLPHRDFIHFGPGASELRGSFVFDSDGVPFARVICSYSSAGIPRLQLWLFSCERAVEYTCI